MSGALSWLDAPHLAWEAGGCWGGDLIKNLVTDLSREARFTQLESYQRFTYACGALLLLSALFHGMVFLIDGGSWEGPVSWRKPIVFGFSFGVTVVTLTWFMTLMRLGTAAGWTVAIVLGVASVGEVFLISMQKWRNVESHFNEDTRFDELVFSLMGFLVFLVALTTILITILSFMRVDAPPSLAWAIRLGLLLLLASQGVGVSMIVVGGNTFGDAGALKVPHAFTLHAAQVLPALALILRLSDSSEERRLRIVVLGAIGYAGLIAATMIQAYGGRATLDVGMISAAAALVGLGLLGVSGYTALRGIASRLTTN
jgi:hypothetical protein